MGAAAKEVSSASPISRSNGSRTDASLSAMPRLFHRSGA